MRAAHAVAVHRVNPLSLYGQTRVFSDFVFVLIYSMGVHGCDAFIGVHIYTHPYIHTSWFQNKVIHNIQEIFFLNTYNRRCTCVQ